MSGSAPPAGRPTDGDGGPPRSLPLPTLAVLSGRGFLTLGACVGAVGWTATALLTARPGLAGSAPEPFDAPALLAAAVWLPLVVLMVTAGVFATPDRVRFASPFLVWGPANGLAGVATVAALAGVLPPATYWLAWTLAGAAGSLATGLSVRQVGGDGRTWLVAAACEALVPLAALGPGGPWPFVLLGTLHVLPLALDVADADRRLGCFAPALVGFVAASVLLLGVVV